MVSVNQRIVEKKLKREDGHMVFLLRGGEGDGGGLNGGGGDRNI